MRQIMWYHLLDQWICFNIDVLKIHYLKPAGIWIIIIKKSMTTRSVAVEDLLQISTHWKQDNFFSDSLEFIYLFFFYNVFTKYFNNVCSYVARTMWLIRLTYHNMNSSFLKETFPWMNIQKLKTQNKLQPRLKEVNLSGI